MEKFGNWSLALAACALTLAACQREPAPGAEQPAKEEESAWTPDPEVPDGLAGVHLRVPGMGIWEDAQDAWDFRWHSGDEALVCKLAGEEECTWMPLDLSTGRGRSHGLFAGKDFRWKEGERFLAFYPADADLSDTLAVPLSYAGQCVRGHADTLSPRAFDYLWARATAATDSLLDFTFSHVGSMLRLRMQLPTGIPISRVDVVPLYGQVAQSLSLNLSTGETQVRDSSVRMSVQGERFSAPGDGGAASLWMAMPPQDLSSTPLAVLAHVLGGVVYAHRTEGLDFSGGKAHQLDFSPCIVSANPRYGFSRAGETSCRDITTLVPAGQYSGIAWLGGTRYAVVDDKLPGGGIVWFDISLDNAGVIAFPAGDEPPAVRVEIPGGTSGSGVFGRDNEGVAYVPGEAGNSGTLFVAAEGDQSIREYDLEGNPTGRSLAIPEDMGSASIAANKGFESLTYNASTKCFWATTEGTLPKDSFYPGLLRLQRFGQDLQPDERYFYLMDAPTVSSSDAASAAAYVFGVPALAALDDGRLIVLEREVYVPEGNDLKKAASSFTTVKLYVIHPGVDSSGILRKTLLMKFNTNAIAGTFANYEGMCLGPVLPDGRRTLLLIADTQGGSSGLVHEFIKVIAFQ